MRTSGCLRERQSPQGLDAMPLGVPSRLKPLAGAKHMGRKTTRYSFEVRDIVILGGLPANISATGLVVQSSGYWDRTQRTAQ